MSIDHWLARNCPRFRKELNDYADAIESAYSKSPVESFGAQMAREKEQRDVSDNHMATGHKEMDSSLSKQPSGVRRS